MEKYPWPILCEPLVKLCQLNNVEVVQIKEKFGGLRFYVDSAPDWLHRYIEAAENASYHICEICGSPAEPDTNYNWIKTFCDKCKKD